MSEREIEILGHKFGERLKSLYDTFVSEAKYPLSFRHDDQVTFEEGVRGQHDFDKKSVHLVRLATGFSEFTIAHEICHAFMAERGFPSTGCSGLCYQGREIYVFGATLNASLTHPVVNSYLKQFGYQQEVHELYAKRKIDIALGLVETQRLSRFECLTDSLAPLELLLVNELEDKLRQRLSEQAPRLLNMAIELSACLGSQLLNTPRSFRSGYVAVVHWIDKYVQTQLGMKKGMLRELLIDPVLSESEKKLPASKVFRLEPQIMRSESTFVLVKYVPDCGYCYSLYLGAGEVAEWERRLERESAAEFVVSIESLETRPS